MSIMISTISIFFCTIASALLFNIKRQNLIFAAIIGAIGWLIYSIVLIQTANIYVATFIAASFVGIAGEIVARYKKSPATVFILPGIIPLVPGAFIYNSMLSLAKGNYNNAVDFGTKTMFIALSISCGIIIALTFRNILVKIKPRFEVTP